MSFFKEFFYFQKSDRRVLIVALTVAVVAMVVVFFMGRGNSETPAPQSDSVSVDTPEYYAVENRKIELFPFDPNTADSTQLLRLGLQPWQVRNIYRYRAKGGVYSRPEDFARLYGLTAGQYRALAPYIRIAQDFRPASEVYGSRGSHRELGNYGNPGNPGNPGNSGNSGESGESGHSGPSGFAGKANAGDTYERDTLKYPIKLRPGEHINLNLADTTQLRKVPGIGSYYARRIVRYREQLGGFYGQGQLLEIEGFPQDALPFFSINVSNIKKLNINTLREDQLRKHPYISFNQARAIANYRRLHGPIHDLTELKLLKEFPQEMIERLAPYLEY